MSIKVIAGTPAQSAMATAFIQRHANSFSDLTVEITLTRVRTEKVEGFTISATKNGNQISAQVGLTLDHVLRYALNALKNWLDAGAKDSLDLIDGPDFPVRGVVEGFYGKPWTHTQKLKGIEYFADFNMNTYFLAPKDDPLQRFNWRSPFTEQYLKDTAELIEHGKLHG
ncbi:MAG: hypothetical protein F2588_01295, partial [Actinobacteria bacterium]|nr:hypothetical protein [Actinomycetota bacterium]